MMLDAVDDLEVVGEAADGQEAIELAGNLNPDLVLMDISMPHMDGLQATEAIQDLTDPPRVLILSMYATPTFVHQALRKGACGYVLKRTLSDELLPALYHVYEGERFLSESLDTSTVNIVDD